MLPSRNLLVQYIWLNEKRGVENTANTRLVIVATHLHLDKMAAILADDILECIFLNENDRIPIQISLKYIPKRPIDNKPQFTDTCVQH